MFTFYNFQNLGKLHLFHDQVRRGVVHSWFDVTNYFATHAYKDSMPRKSVCDVISGMDPRLLWLGHATNGASEVFIKLWRLRKVNKVAFYREKCFVV